jgi:hypothetical protein
MTYCCRAHPEQAVTWRGTGCVICARLRNRRKRPAAPTWPDHLDHYTPTEHNREAHR